MSSDRTAALPASDCPVCGRPMTGRTHLEGSRIRAAAKYSDCHRRCTVCRVGYSNATTNPTLIYSDSLSNVPLEVRRDALQTLHNALNIRCRVPKIRRFGYSTSEDAVTWTVFSFLGQQRPDALPRVVQRLFGLDGSRDTSVLLWGAPITPGIRGGEVQTALRGVVVALGEDRRSPSEPDVILDCGDAGLVVIEVKYLSGNDHRVQANWSRYVRNTGAFADPDAAEASGLYELVRNWRIAHDLAAGRPFAVVNLAPAGTLAATPGMEQFKASLNTSPKHRFSPLTWSAFLASITAECEGLPPWFESYLRDRRLP